MSTLERCIKSINRQSVKVSEIFVVNDGSTDDTVGLCDYLDIKVYSFKNNRGRGFTRNFAIKKAKCNLVLSVDATNIISPDFLEKGLNWVEKKSYSAAYGKISSENLDNAVNRWKDMYLFQSRDYNRGKQDTSGNAGLISGACLLNKKDVLNVGNFSVKSREGEDQELGKRLNNMGFKTIGDYKMSLRCIRQDSVFSVLKRYARWYRCSNTFSFKQYIKTVYYFTKHAIVCDCKEGDIKRALISLICPHFRVFYR